MDYKFSAFLLVLWILGGAIVFGLYYLLYKRTLKKNASITSESFIVKAPLFIGCSHALLGVVLFILFYALSQGYSLRLTTIFFTILTCYIFLGVSIFIGSIAISFVFYKKKLITKKRFGLVALMNIICIILSIISFHILSSSTTCGIKTGYSMEDYLIYLACWVLGGAIVFELYYLLYKRTLKKNVPITNASFIVKAPLFIGCSNVLLGVGLFILFAVLSNGHSPSTLTTIFFTILTCYILLAIPVFIASIAISILFYKKQLISSKKLGFVILMNIICLISFPMLLVLSFFTSLPYF